MIYIIRTWMLLSVGFIAIQFAFVPFAQAQVAPLTTPTTPAEPVAPLATLIDVSARLTGNNRVGEPIYLAVVLKNTTNQAIKLKELRISIDPSVKGRFAKTTCKVNDGEPVIPANLSLEQQCHFVMKSGAFWSKTGDWRNLFFAAEVPLMVELVPSKEGLSKARYLPVVRINAGQFAIFAGGLVGALLLALFLWIERLLIDKNVREAWGRNLLVMGALGLRGGLMAIMALLLSTTTQGAGSPVSLSVNDFSGGVLVGLFSYPLANWISSTLKLDGVTVFTKPVAAKSKLPAQSPVLPVTVPQVAEKNEKDDVEAKRLGTSVVT